MRKTVFALGTILLGALVVTTGCTTKKRHQRDIADLQSQVGALQGEVSRLDQALRDSGIALKTAQDQGAPAGAFTGLSGNGPVYRTPSGFELPAMSIQRALKNAGYYQGAVDGKIGSGTKTALKNFQRDQGLTADGVCGRQTWARLEGFAQAKA